ncbi:MAG: radical SAM protein [Planctomycetes bacterium]|nr:radical SAM protein [Planctomycetota bacterium]
MANISITLRCNRDCPYCFARPGRDGTLSREMDMDRATFLAALAFLRRSRLDQARILGGEPTLHPDFDWFVGEALEQGFRLLVFSNGLMPEAALRRLADAPADRVAVLLNVHSPPGPVPVLRRLGRRIVLGFNIHTPAPDLDFLVPLIVEYDLSRCVRLGLAHPSAGGANVHLRPKRYALVGERIAGFASSAAAEGVSIEFDCGFVPCMFPAGFLESLAGGPPTIGTRCGVIPDILPDGSAVPCYPLAAFSKIALSEDVDAASIREILCERTQGIRTVGIFRDCAQCALRAAKECAGGCLAAARERLRDAPFLFEAAVHPNRR